MDVCRKGQENWGTGLKSPFLFLVLSDILYYIFKQTGGGADRLSNFNDGSGGRRPGRPVGASKRIFQGKCDVRLTAEEDSMLTKLSKLNGVTRSDVMRKALKDYFRFNTEGGVNGE